MATSPRVALELRNPTAVPIPAGSIVTGAVLAKEGELFGPVLAVKVAGDVPIVPIVSQTDVQSRWPDGSILHALVATRLVSDLPGSSTVAAEAYDSASPRTLLVPVPIREYEVLIRVKDDDGVWYANVEGGMDLIKRANFGATDTWKGPLVAEVEAEIPLRDADGNDHPLLVARVRWRLYDGASHYRVSVVLENCSPTPSVGAGAYDVPFSSIRVLADDARVDVPAGTLWDRTRLLIRLWPGTTATSYRPPEERVSLHPPLADLNAGGFLPLLSTDPISRADAGLETSRHAASSLNGRFSGTHEGIPLDPGPIASYMPMTGDRADIGPLPRWSQYALRSNSEDALSWMMSGELNGSASFRIHQRSINDGELGIPQENAGPEWDGRKIVTVSKSPTRDRAHHPLLGYLGWLLYGEAFALEELVSWACYVRCEWPWGDGRFRYLWGRDHAWSMRTLGLASVVVPDGHPRKAYFQRVLQENLAADAATTPYPLGNLDEGAWNSSGRDWSPASSTISPWAHCWVAGVHAWLARLGVEEARDALVVSAALIDRAYARRGEVWTAPDGTVWRFQEPASALAIYGLPVSKNTGGPDGGKWVVAQSVPIDNFGEALYHAAIYASFGWNPGKDPFPKPAAFSVPPYLPGDWIPTRDPKYPNASWIAYALKWTAAELHRAGYVDAWEDPLVVSAVAAERLPTPFRP